MSQYELYKRKLESIFNRISKIAFKGRDNRLEYYKYIDELIEKGDYGVFEQSVYYFFQIDINQYRDVPEVKEKTWNDILYQTTTPFLKRLSKLYKEKNVYQSSYDIFSDDSNRIVINLTGPLSSTYSLIGTYSSISFTKQNENIYLNIDDNDLFSVEISKTKWVDGLPGNLGNTQLIRTGTSSNTYKTDIPTSHGSQYLVKTYKRPNYEVENYKLDIVKSGLLGQIYEVEKYVDDPSYFIKNKLYARIVGSSTFYVEAIKLGATSSVIFNIENPTLSDIQNLINNYKSAIEYLLS